MKLGEALTLRSQLQVKFQQLRERLKASAIVQEGEAPPEDPKVLLRELEAVAAELEKLIARINKTNLVTSVRDGMTLTEALARRDHLGWRLGALHQVAETASVVQARYGKAELRMVRTIDVAKLRQRGDDLAKQRRTLDAQIQEVNWLTELARARVGSRRRRRRAPNATDVAPGVATGERMGFESPLIQSSPAP